VALIQQHSGCVLAGASLGGGLMHSSHGTGRDISFYKSHLRDRVLPRRWFQTANGWIIATWLP
jgi:hypothetical protein